jgi:hypothetical protein
LNFAYCEKLIINKKAADNSGLAQLGFSANFKVGFVLGSSVLNRYIWLTKSPTDAKPRNVIIVFLIEFDSYICLSVPEQNGCLNSR